LFFDKVVNAGEFGYWWVGGVCHGAVGGANHDIYRGKEGDKDGELDDKGENGAHWLDVVALVEVEHLELFELAVAFAILFDFGKFGLDFAHEAGLVELLLNEWPHGKFDDDGEDDDGEAKISDEVINDEEEVDDRANYQKIYELKHSRRYYILGRPFKQSET
jgi:hypothetical protein